RARFTRPASMGIRRAVAALAADTNRARTAGNGLEPARQAVASRVTELALGIDVRSLFGERLPGVSVFGFFPDLAIIRMALFAGGAAREPVILGKPDRQRGSQAGFRGGEIVPGEFRVKAFQVFLLRGIVGQVSVHLDNPAGPGEPAGPGR